MIKNDAILILTDLEPDDVMALIILFQALDRNIPMHIVTGEGKYSKLGMITNFMKPYGFTNISYSEGPMSDKDYPKEALEVFGTEAIEIQMENPDVFLNNYQNPLIVCLMPPRILYKKEYKHCDLALYGSFNLRSLKTDKGKLSKWLNNSFGSVLLYESFLAIGDQNSINSQNSPQLFEKIKTDFPSLCSLIQTWNQCIFKECLESISKYLIKISDLNPNDNNYWDSVQKIHSKAAKKFKIIGSISEAKSEQMVLADFGLIISMLGYIPSECLTTGFIAFNEYGFTVPKKDISGPINFVTGLDFEKTVEILNQVFVKID